eukprot:scaffold7910_cov16-Tisochrysis_lutea.AAC.1
MLPPLHDSHSRPIRPVCHKTPSLPAPLSPACPTCSGKAAPWAAPSASRASNMKGGETGMSSCKPSVKARPDRAVIAAADQVQGTNTFAAWLRTQVIGGQESVAFTRGLLFQYLKPADDEQDHRRACGP